MLEDLAQRQAPGSAASSARPSGQSSVAESGAPARDERLLTQAWGTSVPPPKRALLAGWVSGSKRAQIEGPRFKPTLTGARFTVPLPVLMLKSLHSARVWEYDKGLYNKPRQGG